MKQNKLRALRIARTLLTIGWSAGILVTGIGFTIAYLMLPQLKVLGYNTTVLPVVLILIALLSALVVPFIIHLYFPSVLMHQSELSQTIDEYNTAISTLNAVKRKLMDQVADNIISPQLPHINVRREYFDKAKGTHTLRVYNDHGILIAEAGEYQPTLDITLIYQNRYILFSPGTTNIGDPSKHPVYIQLPEPN